jgi:hypothetical protein
MATNVHFALGNVSLNDVNGFGSAPTLTSRGQRRVSEDSAYTSGSNGTSKDLAPTVTGIDYGTAISIGKSGSRKPEEYDVNFQSVSLPPILIAS